MALLLVDSGTVSNGTHKGNRSHGVSVAVLVVTLPGIRRAFWRDLAAIGVD